MPESRKLRAVVLATAALAFVCSSCVQIAYDGDAKEPKAKRSEVKVFMDKSKIPVQGFRVMGTAEISAPAGFSAAEVEMRLVDFAKAKGADGLLILSVDRSRYGVVRADQALSVTPGTEAVAEESSKVAIKAQLLEFPKKDEEPVKGLPSIEALLAQPPQALAAPVEAAPKPKMEPIPVD